MPMPTPTGVKICEMAPRDGLQSMGGKDAVATGRIVPLSPRVRLVKAMIDAGVRHIEVGAFVSPRGTPQMALSDELGQTLDAGMVEGLELAALVPNEAGYDRFKASGLNVVAIFPTASEAHARKNFGGRTVDEVLAMAGSVSRMALSDGYALRGHVSAAFQDMASSAAQSDLDTVVRVCRAVLHEFGCAYLTLADTNGTTNPARVGEVLDAVGDSLGGLDRIGVHLHDRYGTGVANAYAAWEKGVRIFDSSLGGVGGSVAASAVAGGSSVAGNVATESLVAMFEGMGFSTGIDVDALMTGAGGILNEICTAVGEFSPPSGMLRDRLGYGARWERPQSA
jgi:hydroxymethylglutaryl-CoA lyase